VRHPVVFLPGIIMPARDRYSALINELGADVTAVTKDLEVYRLPEPPSGYSIDTEVAGISRTADERGFDRFHLYGHSAGGAVSIAFAAAHPERLLSLALDEPAMDFTPEDHADVRWAEFARIVTLPVPERMVAFLKTQLNPGVELAPSPPDPQPAWMAQRPAGVVAFISAARQHVIPEHQLRAFDRPVYYSHGSLSALNWEQCCRRLERVFPDFTSELYLGLHHLNTSHVAEPHRVATALRSLWARAESNASA
jgi:pimeloyl-ACP methyl ester carboxylesterase